MRKKPLSEADHKALAFIRAYTSANRRAPSYTEVGAHLNLPFPNNAKRNCDRLVRAGYLAREEIGVREPGRPRALSFDGPHDLVFPFRGPVSCGSGNAPEDGDDTIDIRAFLKTGDSAVFRARGTSMIDAQIADGDLLIVTEDPDPPEGSVVVAMLGDEMLCKRLARSATRAYGPVVLAPCNDDLEAIVVDPALVPFRILGVLRNVIRKV
jgi:repressor LexA